MLSIYLAMLDDADDVRHFEEIYKEYRIIMGKIAFKILHDEIDAFDATHNALIAIAKHIKKCPDGTNKHYEKLYVSMVVRNAAINILRKRKKNVKVIYLDSEKYYTDRSPAYEIIEMDEIDRISKCINEMSYVYRDVLYMKYLYDMNIHEISDILDQSENTVRSKLRRGTEQLREILKSGGIYEE